MKQGRIQGKNAFDLFPDLLKKTAPEPAPAKAPESGSTVTAQKSPKNKTISKAPVAPPLPPDVSWLKKGLSENNHTTDAAAASALIIIDDNELLNQIGPHLTKMGYSVETTDSERMAEKMVMSRPYALIIGHTSLVMGRFHNVLCWLPPAQRRLIFYILIGPNLNTLYDLEAISLSANLVISDNDLQHFDKIMKKGLHDYEKLYGPFLSLLNSSTTLLAGR